VSNRVRQQLTVIMAPEDSPVTNTLAGSPLYFCSAYRTMLASPVLSLPPSWVRVCFDETSQHAPSVGVWP
jgi:hypothetical protein